MNKLEKELRLINNLILGLRKVVRHKSSSLSVLITITNAFFDKKIKITKKVVDYDKHIKVLPSDEQLALYHLKFTKVKSHLNNIVSFLEKQVNSDFAFDKIKILSNYEFKSFQDYVVSIDAKLKDYGVIIDELIQHIDPKNKKQVIKFLDSEIKILLNKNN